MNGDIAEAKRQLPLPALLHRLGLGEHAKKSALCPFHDDKHNSFSVWKNGVGLWFWKCHTGCGEGDEITFLEKHYGHFQQRDDQALS
jgi:DNA primase